jgi:hypothetical protein
MGEILAVVMLVLGLALGGGGVWLLLRPKIQYGYERGKGDVEAERDCTFLLHR